MHKTGRLSSIKQRNALLDEIQEARKDIILLILLNIHTDNDVFLDSVTTQTWYHIISRKHINTMVVDLHLQNKILGWTFA